MQTRKEEPDLQPAGDEKPNLQAVTPPEPKKKNRTLLFVIIAVVALFAIWKGIQYLQYSHTHVSTDNAFLDADISQVSPQVGGTVQKILVQENQHVKAGQLLVVLDDSTYRAQATQAEANLTAALAAKQAADADLALARRTSAGQLTQAKGGVEQAQSGVGQAIADVATADAAIQSARANEGAASAQASQARAGIQSAVENRARALQAVASAQAQLNSAQAALKAARAGVAAAQAHETYSASQARRMQTLANQGAISRQQAEAAEQDLATANAALQSAEDQVTAAQATVADRQAAVASARQGVPLADTAIDQAKAAATAARQQAAASAAALQQAITHRTNVVNGVGAARGKTTAALGQQQAANTVPQVVATKLAAAQQAEAKVEQAKAALAQAQLDLHHTRIYSPFDGTVNKSSAINGATVTPGFPIISVVRDNSLYVDVNLKETQTAPLKVGQDAEIDVDGFPAHPFRGHLTSLSPATGATFALLPPDNASGNFVKVVQRIPVRVDFDPGQPDLDRLRAGMSATVAIKTG